MIFDLSNKSFAAAKFVIPLFLLIVLLILSTLTVSFIEKLRYGDFSYLMVFIGGFFAVNLTNDFFSVDTQALFYIQLSVNIAVTFLLCYFECMLISTMFCAVASTRYKPAADMDYIIILGCAIRRDGTPTPLLRGRIRRAFDFEKAQYEKTGKHAKFVPSGGQGSDEVISEAESMKRCLIELGVPEERIVKEDESVNTYQNMAFSKKGDRARLRV